MSGVLELKGKVMLNSHLESRYEILPRVSQNFNYVVLCARPASENLSLFPLLTGLSVHASSVFDTSLV